MNGFFKGLTGLIMTVLGLGIAVEILYGGGALMGISVIDNIMAVINGPCTNGWRLGTINLRSWFNNRACS
jgi:hypothetical protein